MICPAPAPRPRSSPARTTGLLSEGREVTTTDSRSGLPVNLVLVGEMVNLVVALTGDEVITIDSKSTGENPGLSVVTLIGDDVTTIDSRSEVWPGFSVVVGLVTISGSDVITIASRSGVCPGLKVVVDTVVVLVVVTSTGDEVITMESRSGMVPGVATSQQLHGLDVLILLVAVAAVVIVTTETGGCFVVSSADEVITMDSKSVSGFSVVFGDSARLGGGEGFDVQRRQRT